MTFLERLKRPPWRTAILLLAILAAFGLAYLIWSPGDQVTDGRHDRGTNGMWLQHGWLGHDDWFNRYHDPRAENITHALRGIHAGLKRSGMPGHYLGVAIYCGWETDEDEWTIFRDEFRRP